jgi:hypothetical protein
MSSKMKRLPQLILSTTLLPFCWLAMQATHEFGHVLGAWATGAQVAHVALYPTVFSRTDLAHNPHPLVVVCAGPLIGALFPLAAFLLAAMSRMPGVFLLRFLAGFCLIANGAYMAFGPGEGGADTGIMLSHGVPRVALVLFGALWISTGLYLWHRQGAHFGLGNAQGRVQRSSALASAALLLTLIGVEMFFNSR